MSGGNNTPKKSSSSMGEKNPFKDCDTETIASPRVSRKKTSSKRKSTQKKKPLVGGFSAANLAASVGLGMPLGSATAGLPMSMPSLSAMYGSQQAGYNPLLMTQPGMQPSGFPGQMMMPPPQFGGIGSQHNLMYRPPF